VADAFDAMTSDRPYRRRLDQKQAIGELKKNSGEQFDPEIVQLFTRLWEKSDLNRLLA
jgi:HD-GYP domain-containing protein (c-di-GMP phosphodiesterase class II)